MDRGPQAASERTDREAVGNSSGSSGEGDALGGNRQHRGSESFFGDALSSPVGAAFYRSTTECTQCPSTTGARTAPGRNLECARGPQSGSEPHRQLGRKSLGSTAGRSLCGASWSCGGDRTAVGWKPLAALPRPLSAPASLPRTAAAVRKSFRPTASRTCGTNTKTQKQNQTQIPCTCKPPLEKTMEADISIWQKPGHFYFALTNHFRSLTCHIPRPKMCAKCPVPPPSSAGQSRTTASWRSLAAVAWVWCTRPKTSGSTVS